jgi:hypothetical protein
MAKFRVCAECEDEFDVDSPEKKRAVDASEINGED